MFLLNKNKFLVFGHRGAPMFAQENTLLSFKKAIEFGVKAIELDVHLTKDEQVIVFHDFNLIRLADRKDEIENLNYDQIKSFDISKKWNSVHGAQHIPLLKDVIDLLKPSNIIINIEIKSKRLIPTKIVELVNDIIIENEIENKCIVSSFNPFIVRKIKKVNSNIFSSLIWSNKGVPIYYKFYKISFLISKPDGFHSDKSFVNSNIIRWARSKNMYIFLFTVNDKEEFENFKNKDVDGVFTDNPKEIK